MNNTTSPSVVSPRLEEIIYTVFMMLISLVGVGGNAAVILAVIVNKKLRSSTNFLVLNLSLADFLVCLVAIPLRVMTGIFPELLLYIECHVILALTIFFDGASRLNTLIIALDRFVAIKWPFLYISMVTKRVLFLMISVGWSVVLSVGLLPIFGVGLKTNLTTNTMCFFYNNLSTGFVFSFVFGFCILPLVVIIPVNCFLFRTSFRQMREIYKQRVSLGIINPVCTAADEDSKDNFKHETKNDTYANTNKPRTRLSLRIVVTQSKVAKMVTILMGTFVVLVTPISLIDLIKVTSSSIYIPHRIAQTAVGMIYLNAAVNVFIYAGYSREFRKTFQCMYQRARDQFSSEIVGPASVTGVKCKKTTKNGDVEKNGIELLSFKKHP